MSRILCFLALVVFLTGCGTPVARFTTSPSPDLLSARQQAGIADCPPSDAKVAARSDGLPDITLDCLGGDSTVRLAGLRGKPMVINLWAQWCAPCREEAPSLREFGAVVGRKVLLLGIDYSDPRPDLAVEFAALAGWKHPQLVDQEHVLQAPLRAPGIPVTLLVDADGRIVHRITGPVGSADQLKDLVSEKFGIKL